MLIRFCQHHEARRLQPHIHLFNRERKRSWRAVDARMCNDGKKLVEARPRNCPAGIALGKPGNLLRRDGMEWRILTMRVNQDIGVDSNQEPLS